MLLHALCSPARAWFRRQTQLHEQIAREQGLLGYPRFGTVRFTDRRHVLLQHLIFRHGLRKSHLYRLNEIPLITSPLGASVLDGLLWRLSVDGNLTGGTAISAARGWQIREVVMPVFEQPFGIPAELQLYVTRDASSASIKVKEGRDGCLSLLFTDEVDLSFADKRLGRSGAALSGENEEDIRSAVGLALRAFKSPWQWRSTVAITIDHRGRATLSGQVALGDVELAIQPQSDNYNRVMRDERRFVDNIARQRLSESGRQRGARTATSFFRWLGI